MPVRENFCRKIRGEKMSQAELARRTGLKLATINGFEFMRHNLAHENVIKIANVLGVRPEDIVPNPTRDNEYDPLLSKKAIKLTHQYFADDHLDEKLMIEIVKEVYKFLVLFKDMSKNKDDIKEIEVSLNRDFTKGLAAKCVLDFIKQKNKL